MFDSPTRKSQNPVVTPLDRIRSISNGLRQRKTPRPARLQENRRNRTLSFFYQTETWSYLILKMSNGKLIFVDLVWENLILIFLVLDDDCEMIVCL